MSYQLFKTEILAKNGVQFNDRMKASKVIGNAYNNLIQRHFEVLSGGGQFSTLSPKTQILIQGIQQVFEQNSMSHNRVNIWSQFAPHIYSYWTGGVAIGSTGIVTITSTGVFKGPPIPENDNPQIWINVFIGVISVHITTLVGTYTNFVTGITVPWSGALLKTFP